MYVFLSELAYEYIVKRNKRSAFENALRFIYSDSFVEEEVIEILALLEERFLAQIEIPIFKRGERKEVKRCFSFVLAFYAFFFWLSFLFVFPFQACSSLLLFILLFFLLLELYLLSVFLTVSFPIVSIN